MCEDRDRQDADLHRVLIMKVTALNVVHGNFEYDSSEMVKSDGLLKMHRYWFHDFPKKK